MFERCFNGRARGPPAHAHEFCNLGHDQDIRISGNLGTWSSGGHHGRNFFVTRYLKIDVGSDFIKRL